VPVGRLLDAGIARVLAETPVGSIVRLGVRDCAGDGDALDAAE